MKLILVRHGETVENTEDRAQGHLPGKLSELGVSQAKRLGLKLKDEKIDAIYSSDLARAADTAKEIAKYHDADLILTEDLRERGQGEAEGRTHAEINKIGRENLKGAEPMDDFRARVHKFIAKIKEKHPDDCVVIVAHGGPIAAILHEDVSAEEELFAISGRLKNTGITVLDPYPSVKLLNDTDHL